MDAWLGFFLRLLLVVSVSRFPVSANRRFGEFGTVRVGSRVFLLSCRPWEKEENELGETGAGELFVWRPSSSSCSCSSSSCSPSSFHQIT
ncbi:hypothetical protein FQA47_006013 [Oryzias melastigma]|uniref:Secreted protein n=1 Tax=Oryzias melastigma TaxID=30732 RepID=A0A834C926_ORYME|nr:hypothetical protein FQA47_006013 [Oryzias melastigma]